MLEEKVLFEVSAGKTVIAERTENLLEGEFAKVQWNKLRKIAELFSRVIARYLSVELDDLEIREAYRDSGRHLSPVLRVYCSPQNLDFSSKNIEGVILSTTSTLVSSNENQDSIFNAPPLPNDAKEIINEFLLSHGGKGIKEEIHLTFMQR